MPGELTTIVMIIFHLKLHIHVMVSLSIKLSSKESKLLYKLLVLGPISSYKLAQRENIPSATAWRILKKLAEEGYAKKGYRSFYITPKGLIMLYKEVRDENARTHILQELKEKWKYEGDTQDLKEFIENLIYLIENEQINVNHLCFNYPTALAGFLYPFAERFTERSKKVIAYYLLKMFPSVCLPNSCRAIISINDKGEPYAIAVDCKKNGLKINYFCDELKAFIAKNCQLKTT